MNREEELVDQVEQLTERMKNATVLLEAAQGILRDVLAGTGRLVEQQEQLVDQQNDETAAALR
jgi:adenylosuccinate synthase